MEKYNYRGCGKCPLSGLAEEIEYGACVKEYRVNLRIKITKLVRWEDWNVFRTVFNVGDVVAVDGVAKDGILYCCSGESTLHPGVKDYIDLDAIEILEIL